MITPDFLEILKCDSDYSTLQKPEEIYKNKSRVCNEALLQSEQPIDVFMSLFPISLWNKIAIETDRYKQQ